MKKLLIIFLLPSFLLACSKEKQPSIVGSWEKIATYRDDSAGNFSWTPVSTEPYPFRLCFSETGLYSMSFREPMGGGNYHYDPATKDLQLGQTPADNLRITVSLLDDDYLVIENYFNNVLQVKSKYQRQDN